MATEETTPSNNQAQPAAPESNWTVSTGSSPSDSYASWEANPPDVYDNQNQTDAITWSASEYVHHEKSGMWYIRLALVAIPLVIAIYFITSHDIVATAATGIIAVLFGVGAARPPRSLEYRIDEHGITIGLRHFSFAAFKSFSVIEDNALQTVVLDPLKRFMPPLSMYCPPDQADAIINAIGHFLPYEQKEIDAIDVLMKKLRF